MLDISGMGFFYWLVLFSTSCFANVLGLNVSDSFNSAKVIYILIPVLIIPQLLFSGIIVNFDKLHPWFASERSVPLVGNVMASRWAYEALAVTQFKENEYERNFYVYDQRMKYANWKKDIWVRDLLNRVAIAERHISKRAESESFKNDLAVLRNEIGKEVQLIKGITFNRLDELHPDKVTQGVLTDVHDYLDELVLHYRKVYNRSEGAREERIIQMTNTEEKREAYFTLHDEFRNEGLADIVTNKNDLEVVAEYQGELIQKSDPIYQQPIWSGLFSAHFYAPSKNMFGARVKTIWANTMVLWGMCILLILTLQFSIFPRLLNAASQLKRR